MSTKKILTAKEILDKKFASNAQGYDALEVDQFFDDIIFSMKSITVNTNKLQMTIDALKTEIVTLKNKVLDLEVERTKLTKKVAEFDGKKDATKDNIVFLNRIKALENALYALGVNPTKIK